MARVNCIQMIGLLENLFSKLSLLFCFCMAWYMTYLQFNYYLSNGDLVAISYRKFNAEEKDEYPTITVCLWGATGAISNKINDIWISPNNTKNEKRNYYEYLSGKLEDHSDRFSTINFDDVAISLNDGYLKKAATKLSTTLGDTQHEFGMVSSFSHVKEVCYTKNVSYQKDVTQISEDITLNKKLLRTKQIFISVIIHQKGKLIRHLSKENTRIMFNDLKRSCHILVFDIGLIEVVVRREKGKIPCNKHLVDEDAYILNSVLKNVGCMPTFWERFNNTMDSNGTLLSCKNQQDFRRFADEYQKIVKSVDSINSFYVQPCTQMMIPMAKREIVRPCYFTPETQILRLNYNHDLYREILNTKEYTIETLLGQVGGFVGRIYKIIMRF